LVTSFTIENDFVLSSLSKTHIFDEESSGSFDLSFEKVDEHVILKIDGDVRTNDSEIKLVINSDNSIIYEANLPLSDGYFYDNVILYDYENDVPWENIGYEVNAFVEENIVDSKTFTFDESSSLRLKGKNKVFPFNFFGKRSLIKVDENLFNVTTMALIVILTIIFVMEV